MALALGHELFWPALTGRGTIGAFLRGRCPRLKWRCAFSAYHSGQKMPKHRLTRIRRAGAPRVLADPPSQKLWPTGRTVGHTGTVLLVCRNPMDAFRKVSAGQSDVFPFHCADGSSANDKLRHVGQGRIEIKLFNMWTAAVAQVIR